MPARVRLVCPLVVANMLYFLVGTALALSWISLYVCMCVCACVRVEDSNGTNDETWSGQNAKKPVITLEGNSAEVKFGKELANVHFEHRYDPC